VTKNKPDQDGENVQATLDEAHSFWRKPDKMNRPSTYIPPRGRSEFLLEKVRHHGPPNPRILEIGCNVGRNLDCLFQNGFENLEAIEINPGAVKLLRKTFPAMAEKVTIHNASVEDTIKKLGDARFDVVYSMAVLEHIHEESRWIFPEVVRITKDVLITIEDEGGVTPLHFPRNYREVFEPLGMRQVEKIECNDVFELTPEVVEKYKGHMVSRVFRKA
jgi:SAM-dependent methyltransferase